MFVSNTCIVKMQYNFYFVSFSSFFYFSVYFHMLNSFRYKSRLVIKFGKLNAIIITRILNPQAYTRDWGMSAVFPRHFTKQQHFDMQTKPKFFFPNSGIIICFWRSNPSHLYVVLELINAIVL